MSDPVLWLRRQILAGRITARKVGRHWRFTPADVDHALAALANTPKTVAAPKTSTAATPPTPLSAGSLRRRSATPTPEQWWERHPAWKAVQK